MCREAGKGGDPCVTNETPCNICANFTEQQQIRIKHRCRYVRKQKVSDPCNTSKDDDLDLLGMMWRRFLALKQTLRVLLIIYFHLLHTPTLTFWVFVVKDT